MIENRIGESRISLIGAMMDRAGMLAATAFTQTPAGLLPASMPHRRAKRHHTAGAFGRGLTKAANKARREAMKGKKTDRRDEDGAFTLVGRPRRIWLAGISAARGY